MGGLLETHQTGSFTFNRSLGLHPLAIEDCLDDDQIPKIEDYPNHAFILFNRIEYRKDILVNQRVGYFYRQ